MKIRGKLNKLYNKKAELSKLTSDLLIEIKSFIKCETEEHEEIKNSIEIDFSESDGFMLNDSNGNNYNLDAVIESICKNGFVTIDFILEKSF